MLKKRKHKIKRRNTEPSVNHQTVLATASSGAAGSNTSGTQLGMLGADGGDGIILEHPTNVNLADICDSPTHATAV